MACGGKRRFNALMKALSKRRSAKPSFEEVSDELVMHFVNQVELVRVVFKVADIVSQIGLRPISR